MMHENVVKSPPSVTNLPVGFAKCFEGAEAHDDEWVVSRLYFHSLLF